MAGGDQPAAGEGRRYWRWSKADFFPEPSFQSWRSYGGALAATVPRLRDRVAARSTDAIEAGTLLAESENPLRRCLSWVDLAFLGFGSVVGSGVFVLTGQEARFDAGPAIPLAYAAAGFSALLSFFCYAELATEIPSAGGSFSYLRIELGDMAAFLAAGNILLEAVVGAAGLGRSWTSYLAALLGRDSDSLRIHVPALAEGFNLLDPIAVVVLISTSALAMSGARLTSTINSLASVIGIVIIAFVMGFGFSHFDSSNLEPSFFPFGAAGVFRAAAVVYWSYTGFDMVATMAEETKNPGRDVPLGLLSSMSAITVVYCAISLALVGMQKYSDIDPNAAYSVAFAATGLKWARYIVALGALKGMTSGLLVGALGQARYTTQIARTHMIPPYFALVHPKTGTPVYATMAVTLGRRLRRALLQPGRARVSLLHQHALHLRARGRRAARPPLLRRREDAGLAAAHLPRLPGAAPRVVHRHVGVLQLELRRAVAGLRGVRHWMGGRHGGAGVWREAAARAQDVRRAAHAVAAGHVRGHQPLPDGLARVTGLHALRHLHGGDARLLRALRRARDL